MSNRNSISTPQNFGSIKVQNFSVTPPPEFKYDPQTKRVKWGKDNLYPDYLTGLYLTSPRHGSIINAKIDYILGGGLTYDKTNLLPAEQAKADAFIKFFMETGCATDMVRDGEIINGVALEIIFNKKKTKPVEINHIPFSRIRTNEDESKYFYSRDWKKTIQDESTGFKEFDVFDPKSPSDSQLFVYVIKAPPRNGQVNAYPTPNYQAGVIAIESDVQVGIFDNSNLTTGFTAGKIINFNNGVPSTEAAKGQIVDSVKKKTQGAENAGEVIISFNNSKDKETTVVDITPSDLDKQNVEVDKRTEARIFTVHKITNPALFGLRNEGAISGDNNLVADFELFQSIYVDGRQKWHEKYINQIAKYFGVTCEIVFKRVKPVAQPIDSTVISAAYTQNEVRQILGLHTIDTKKSDGSKEIVNALNSLSPLVANKVLENLTADEIRSLIGLGAGAKPTQMSSQNIIETVFSKHGRKKELFSIIKSQEFNFESPDETIVSEFLFASELTTLERNIIDMIDKDNKISVEGIAKALKVDIKSLQPVYDSLVEGGYIIENDGEAKPSADAKKVIKKEKPKTKDFEIVYGYDWRVGFSDKDKKTSRDFCAELMAKDLLYTRAEIDQMSNDMGTDVWTFKGGWYTKPDTDQHLPYCRHTWHQYLVKIKP